MPPIADFVCNGPKCRMKHGAHPVYELPTKATRCPVCGTKKIARLYNAVRVNTGAKPDHFDGRHTSSSMARRLDALVEEPVSAALSKRDELKTAALPYRHDGPPGRRWRNDNGMVKVVPGNRFGAALHEVYHKGDVETQYPPTMDEETRKQTRLLKGTVTEMPGILADMNAPGRPPTAVVASDKGMSP